MPAEWENHSATQLHWPANRETWPGDRLERVEIVYAEIISVLHRYEPVLLLVNTVEDRKRAESILKKFDPDIDLNRIHFHIVPLNDVWARDCGPVFIKRRSDTLTTVPEYAITNWIYNAWGQKYPPFDSDNKIPEWFADHFSIYMFSPDMVLEGGAIDTNGKGVLLTTESVLLNPNRNPQLTKAEIGKKLKRYLGMEKIIWLKKGLAGDDTDGHIDDLSRFLNENTILTMICEDENDVNYAALNENLDILRKSTDPNGNPFQILTLPMPKTRIEGSTVDGSEYVPASYANFYIANGVVLVPLYDERYDQAAIDLMSRFFPGRDIVGIECSDLVWGQGSIHCITQQLYGLENLG
ncbi:agmatine deiminase family protein [Rhodohalobacter mucosus]|nr:agmatine deiminase family protein [Rhodohalobacter mucosus]